MSCLGVTYKTSNILKKVILNSNLGQPAKNKTQNAPENTGARNVFIQITVFAYIKLRSTNGGQII